MPALGGRRTLITLPEHHELHYKIPLGIDPNESSTDQTQQRIKLSIAEKLQGIDAAMKEREEIDGDTYEHNIEFHQVPSRWRKFVEEQARQELQSQRRSGVGISFR